MTHGLPYKLTTCLTCRHTLPELPAPVCSTSDQCINLLPALLAATPYLDSLLQYAVPMTHGLLYQLTIPALLPATPYLDCLLQYAVPMTHGLLYQFTTCLPCRHIHSGLPATVCSTIDSWPSVPTYYLPFLLHSLLDLPTPVLNTKTPIYLLH